MNKFLAFAMLMFSCAPAQAENMEFVFLDRAELVPSDSGQRTPPMGQLRWWACVYHAYTGPHEGTEISYRVRDPNLCIDAINLELIVVKPECRRAATADSD